jgi:serine/threonine-protein kinase HipA
MPQGISVSGVQPKLGLRRQGGRYVARTRAGASTRVIAKLPVAGRPHMPQLEMLSLQMASAAGVEVCHAELAPLSAIAAEHSYALPDEPEFLAVTRFDRDGARRIHFEDFAQVLAIDPMRKYSGSYLDMALAMRAFPSLGDEAVLELVRRLAVNDLFAPAYDIVAYAALQGVDGHALPLLPAAASAARRTALFTPASVRAFCFSTGLHEPLVRRVIADTARLARDKWPAMIEASALPAPWKKRLQQRLQAHPLLQAISKGGKQKEKAAP